MYYGHYQMNKYFTKATHEVYDSYTDSYSIINYEVLESAKVIRTGLLDSNGDELFKQIGLTKIGFEL